MPRKPIDYSRTIIYKLCCKDPNIKDVYVGSTTDFRKRKSGHKSDCNNPNSKHHNVYVYQFIRENGGWQNWDMIMIKKYTKCESKLQCLKKERRYIEKLNTTLNITKPLRTVKEYREDNKEILKQKTKIYREKNKEKIKEKGKKYWINNKVEITKRRNVYREKNKEKIKQYKNEKIKCECGLFIGRTSIARHRKSKKHLKLLQQQNQ